MSINQFFIWMLKIPTFIIGGLLILTGLAGYLFQDLGLSLKLTGPLADDAEFTLSDGNDSISVDLGFPSSKSAGEYAFWMVHRLNVNHAKDRSQANYAVEQGSTAYETQSFWHASSKGDTQEALVVHAETGELGNLAETDANRSTVRLVYKDFTGNTSPVTLTSTNWTNIESKAELKPGDSLQFSKSWTAFIPGILGIILIILAQAAELASNARKHIMHVAVLVGLVGFIAVGKMLPKAISEMSWLKGETYGIIHASSLKATTMLASAGLLLVFVILCVVSFITARKEMAAQKKAEADKKKKVLDKVKTKNKEADAKKSDKSEEGEKKEKSSDDKKKDGDTKDSQSKDSEDKNDSSKDSDKKEDEQKDSEDKSESEDSKKADDNSKTTAAPKPEVKKEPAKTKEHTSAPKNVPKPSTDKKSEAPKASTDINKKKSDEPSKEASSAKDSTSSSDSNSKDQDDSKEEKEAAPKPETEDKNEEKPEPKSDSDKSNKEDNKE